MPDPSYLGERDTELDRSHLRKDGYLQGQCTNVKMTLFTVSVIYEHTCPTPSKVCQTTELIQSLDNTIQVPNVALTAQNG